MSGARRPWWIFAAGAALVLSSLVWLSVAVHRLESAERAAHAQEAHRASTRLALWRMDSWLAPVLAREAARRVVDFAAFQAPRIALNRALMPLPAGDTLVPSPLLTFQPDLVRLHFEWSAEAGFRSPQVPGHEAVPAAAASGVDPSTLPARREALARVADALDAPRVLASARPPAPGPDPTRREAATERCVAGDLDDAAEVGPLGPVWLADGGLAFVRRVRAGERLRLQGFTVDLPALRGQLLAQVGDLFAEARLVSAERAAKRHRLTTLPLALQTQGPTLVGASRSTSLRLAAVWVAALFALTAVGLTLRASIELAERRARFVSAVTHELRTPLTTFRMYTEMLADGMVTDPEQQALYFDTLHAESERLSGLIGNVLAYARLEGKRRPARREATTLDGLLDRVTPPLLRRVEQAGSELAVSGGSEAPLELDVEAVGQILFNLVDNACKYGAPPIEVGAEVEGGLRITVRDQGPGIDPECTEKIFEAFERAGRDDSESGVGLGLSLARGLARDLGGELRWLAAEACFELSLPRALSASAQSG